jgi:hypothetical protein
MILNLFRRIFGCYADNVVLPVFLLDEENEHTIVTGKKTESSLDDEAEGFVSYTEEAMDNVTDGRFKFAKYRAI